MSLTYQEYLDSPAGQLELRGEERGEKRGEIKALMKLLDIRGIAVSTEDRARIEGCTDSAMIDRWFTRAANASTLDEIFD